ncbi:MAG: hypothetical protein ACR2IT_09465 [Pirellulales bacterium]
MRIECAKDGETVWTVFVSSADAVRVPVYVHEAEVVSAEHGIVRETANGAVRTLYCVETVVASEQEAHEVVAKTLSAWAANMMALAAEHAGKAAALGVGEAVPV